MVPLLLLLPLWNRGKSDGNHKFIQNEKDYEFLQTIFFNQTICRLKYEVMIMTVSKNHLKKLWRVEECDLFA